MARYSVSIETEATGPLGPLAFEMSEDIAQVIFQYMLGSAAPITRERPAPTQANPDAVERYRDTRTLGECLRDRAAMDFNRIVKAAYEWRAEQAANAARDPAPLIEPST